MDIKDFDQRQNLLAKIKAAECAFRKAKEQVAVLDRKIRETEIRYEKAVKDGRKSFRYVLRQRLLVIDRIREYYDEYVSRKSDEIRFTWRMLFGRASEDMLQENRSAADESDSSLTESELDVETEDEGGDVF